jgi:hypothetical protein
MRAKADAVRRKVPLDVSDDKDAAYVPDEMRTVRLAALVSQRSLALLLSDVAAFDAQANSSLGSSRRRWDMIIV